MACSPLDGAELPSSSPRRNLQQLSEAAQSFSLQLDYEKLLLELARQGHCLIDCDCVIVYSNFDSPWQAKAEFPATHLAPTEVPDEVTWCVRYLRPTTNAASLDDRASPGNSLFVPIVSTQNRAIGVLEFRCHSAGRFFDADDKLVAKCLAHIASSAVDRARLFFRIEEWKRSMETLLSFNATVNQQLEPEQMLGELVSNVTGFLGADGATFGLAIRRDSAAILVCDGFYFSDRWHEFSRCWKSGEGVPGIVLETEFPYLIDDYRSDPLAEPLLNERFDLGSCICVPIKNAREHVLGFFQLHRRSGRSPFSWQDAAFLESLGNTAAVAIENARLVKSLEMKNAQIKSLSLDHVQRLEEERKHIARELHDETGQVLIGLKLRLKLLSSLLTEDQQDAKTELDELGRQLGSATANLKDLAKRLRPPTLDELGFESAIRQLASEFRRHAKLTIHLDVGSIARLPNASETALYRIVQECLTNIAKHARASRVSIEIRKEGERQLLRITDDGIGFDPDAENGGLGFVGIRERVHLLGGQLHIDSQRGIGTTIEVFLTPAEAK